MRTGPVQRFSLTKLGQQMVADNIGLAFKFANSHRRPYGMDLEDWTAEICMAVMKAAASFNPNLGFKFSTYAYKTMFLVAGDIHRKARRKTSHLYNERSMDPADPVLKLQGKLSGSFAEVDMLDEYSTVEPHIAKVHDGNLLREYCSSGDAFRKMAADRGISRERVRQRIECAIHRVRASMRRQLLESR